MAATSESNNGATPLHVACQRNLSDIAAYLLRCNASPLVTQTLAGQTAFDLACSGVAVLLPACRGFLTEVVQLHRLLTSGGGRTRGHANVVQQLLEAGFRVNARSGCGDGIAAVGRANPAARDCSGRTVVELLQSFGSPEHLRLAEDVACRAELNSSRRDSKATATTGAQQQPPAATSTASVSTGGRRQRRRSFGIANTYSKAKIIRPVAAAAGSASFSSASPAARHYHAVAAVKGVNWCSASEAPSAASASARLTFNEEQQASGQQQQPEPIAEELDSGSCQPISDDHLGSSSRLSAEEIAGQESHIVSDETKEDSQPISDETKEDSQPISEETKEDSQPISEENKEDSQPISDETKEDSQPISEENKEDSQPISDETKEDSQPTSDETKRGLSANLR
uniref:ANK_REP_REGION domain-containing protein n=1 Tax=Macrostomum lignano TaxID=282301 RepID=A0A1I8F822_9PLAT